MRIFAVSDLHTDFQENWDFLKRISTAEFCDDILIVAGDVSDKIPVIRKTFELLQRTFKYICYVPGNHEFWVRTKLANSQEKFNELLDLCDQLGIYTTPHKFGDTWIVPLFSWYEINLQDAQAENDEMLQMWADFYLCKWSDPTINLVEYFLSLNEKYIPKISGEVISFSHFLPRPELMPNPAALYFKGLLKVSLCSGLLEQINKINSKIHVFGHTHIKWNMVIDNIKYIQNPLGYPRERKAAGRFEFQQISDFV